jgi:hypothetical protein
MNRGSIHANLSGVGSRPPRTLDLGAKETEETPGIKQRQVRTLRDSGDHTILPEDDDARRLKKKPRVSGAKSREKPPRRETVRK